MDSQLPSPPSSRLGSSEPSSKPQKTDKETEALSFRLNALLIEYLSLLDTYAILRAQLSKDFSSGFFALAQANRNANSTLGAGRRYGEEGYDERMKAGRIVSLRRGGIHSNEGNNDQGSKEDVDARPKEEHSPKKRFGKEEEARTASDNIETDGQDQNSAHTYSLLPSSTPTKDPLKWYGILIPPALRTCQNDFTSAISTTVPGLLNTTSEMRRLEEDIWALRRELDIIDEYNLTNGAANQTEDTAGG